MDNKKENNIYINAFKIYDFDTSSEDKRYRVVCSTCDIEINQNLKYLLDFIVEHEGKSLSYIISQFLAINNYFTEQGIEKALKDLLKKGILTENENKKVSLKDLNSKPLFRNKMEKLWFRFRLLDTDKHNLFFEVFSFIFSRPFVFAVISTFLILDIIFLGLLFFSEWSKTLIYYSSLDYFYIFLGFSIISVLFHEFGHIIACKRYNIKTPGGIGIGLYYYFLVFYSDTHESWILPRKQRMVVSAAGLYFNIISIIPIFFLCYFLKSSAIKDLLLLIHITVITIFNPFLKMDGYWFFCDFLGVPNLQNKLKIYILKYLPLKYFKKKKVIDPFQSYPGNIRKGVVVYFFFFLLFMVAFLAIFLTRAINIFINLDDQVINKVNFLIGNWEKRGAEIWIDNLNLAIRNLFIILGASMIIIRYSLSLIKIIFKKLRSKYEPARTE